jgi:hypothetical protein
VFPNTVSLATLRSRSLAKDLTVGLWIALLLVICTVVVYLAGGTSTSYTYSFILLITLAAYHYGLAGSLGFELADYDCDAKAVGAQDAKRVVIDLVQAAGLRGIDVGPLERARQLEGLGYLGISLQASQGTNFASAWKFLA